MREEGSIGWSFEILRTALTDLEEPAGEDRHVVWVIPDSLALAKTSRGLVEVFLVGPRLTPATAVVRRHMEHRAWLTSRDEREILANRIILPRAPHFVSIAALIAVELIQAGIGTSRTTAQAFTEVEPIVELALRREALAGETVRGLIGELLTLEQALLMVMREPMLRGTILDMWQGHHWGARDFVVGATGIEVKTTLLSGSTHQISSLTQVEPTPTDSSAEIRLYLLSFGLAPVESVGFSLPEIVDRVLALLRDPAVPEGTMGPLQERLVRDVASYGSGGDSVGYHHIDARGGAAYQQRYQLTYMPRMYDMSDDEVRIIRSSDLTGSFVSQKHLSYQIDLPDRISDENPTSDWRRLLRSLVFQAMGK